MTFEENSGHWHWVDFRWNCFCKPGFIQKKTNLKNWKNTVVKPSIKNSVSEIPFPSSCCEIIGLVVVDWFKLFMFGLMGKVTTSFADNRVAVNCKSGQGTNGVSWMCSWTSKTSWKAAQTGKNGWKLFTQFKAVQLDQTNGLNESELQCRSNRWHGKQFCKVVHQTLQLELDQMLS